VKRTASRSTPDSVFTVICLTERGETWPAGCDPTSPVSLRRDRITSLRRDPAHSPCSRCTLA
jgi:hypothetical protein